MEQSSSECNSKEGASIVSADKDFLGKKRSKRSKSKSSNSSKHETSSSGSGAGNDAELTQKHNHLQHNKSNNNTNNNESSSVSVPIQKPETLHKVKETKAAGSSKPQSENLNKPKETKVVSKSSSTEKPKHTPAASTAADTPEVVSSKHNSSTKATSQRDSSSLPPSEKRASPPSSEKQASPPSSEKQASPPSLEKQAFVPSSEKQAYLPAPEIQAFEKITSPVEVTPEPPPSDVKKSVLAMGRLLEPRSNQPIATAPNNPWPKYIREIQRCLNSLDRLNDELNMNCDYAASEISDLFGEMQIALQNREHYLLLELETLRNTASALLAERWDLGTALKKKVTRMNVFTPDSNRELQQEIQQYIADRKLDKDIANKCRFTANRRDGLHYAKNFGHVESILPTYTSLIMANTKLKNDEMALQEMPYSVMEVMPMETGYNETGWVNKQFLPLDLSSYGPYAAIMNPIKDLQVISLDQMMFLQPQPVVAPLPIKAQQASPRSEPLAPRKSDSDESDKSKEDTNPTLEKVYSKLSAEELLVIQNRVRESLLKQGVKLYPPDGMEDELGNGKSKPLLTSAQREKKRQKRHRYRERKRLERRAERLEQASDSSNSATETTSTQHQQPDTKATTSSKHKKPSHKKDKSKSKSTSENEGSKSPPAKETDITDSQSKVGSPAQVHSRAKTTKLPRKQTNSEQSNASQANGSSTDTTETPSKSRNSYAENTTSGEEPSMVDDTNMSPASDATADTGQPVEKPKEPSVNSKTKPMPNIKNCNTEDNTDT